MEETTYLEDFLASIEFLPNDLRRDFELMREHDKDGADTLRELYECEQNFTQRAVRLVGENSFEANAEETAAKMAEISTLRQRAKQRMGQKVHIASNVLKDLEKFIRKLDTDLTYFESELRTCGEFEQLSKGVEPGSDVAIRINTAGTEIILGKVICYHPDQGMYDIADIDNSKKYYLPESQVAILDMVDHPRRLSKGEDVLAVYPDTTSFYPALIAQAPRRATATAEASVAVQFHEDENDKGELPIIMVPLRHVLRIPDGWLR